MSDPWLKRIANCRQVCRCHQSDDENSTSRVAPALDLSAPCHAAPWLQGEDVAPPQIWTSTLKRTIQTARHLPFPKLRWKALDEIDAGVWCAGGQAWEATEGGALSSAPRRGSCSHNERAWV